MKNGTEAFGHAKPENASLRVERSLHEEMQGNGDGSLGEQAPSVAVADEDVLLEVQDALYNLREFGLAILTSYWCEARDR